MAREAKKRKEPKRKAAEKTRQGEGQHQEGGEKGKDEPAAAEDLGC